jgi:hypothetical protein
MNISFKIKVHSSVYYSFPITDRLFCRQDSIAIGISSDMRAMVNERPVIFVIWGVLKISS